MAQEKTSKDSTPLNPFTYALEVSTEMVRDQMQRMETLKSSMRDLEAENRKRAERYASVFGSMVDDSIEYANQLAAEWRQTMLASLAAARASTAAFASMGK